MTVGGKVREMREKLGMTQQELAKETGIPQATISRIERGILPQPKLRVLIGLAEALSVTVDYLGGRTDRMSESDVVDADPRAKVILRGYQDLDEQDKRALAEFVRYLRTRRRQHPDRTED